MTKRINRMSHYLTSGALTSSAVTARRRTPMPRGVVTDTAGTAPSVGRDEEALAAFV